MKKFTLLLSLLFAIISIQAQDYLISFAGTGASTTVSTVTVENLTQGKSISLLGSEVLHLSGTWNGINTISNSENVLRIYPNPTTENSTIGFVATASGITNVELFDITGKRLGAIQNTLTIGTHSYQLSGLRSGIYTVRVSSQAYTYTGKLVSNGAPNSAVKICYLGNSVFPITPKLLKSASAEKLMQYNTGDRLMITGASGNYSTVVIDIPTQSKTITFPFVACTDGDGNNYTVVQIGSQLWMVENLKTNKYNDGTAIPLVTDNTVWTNLSTPAYCWYNNDATTYKNTYGALYDWYAVNTGKLAPTGWHVPTDVEWTMLTTFLGGESVAGGKLKEAGTLNWFSPNTGATNETGFSALPGGGRGGDYGTFVDVGIYGYWWSSTEGNATGAWYRGLGYDIDGLGRLDDGPKSYGLSVRCVCYTGDSPLVTTDIPSSITSNSAVYGGNVLYEGSSAVVARGVCWSTSPSPTIALSTKTTEAGTTGSFTSLITGLSANTTYYLRAYAINNSGTVYGNEDSFKTFDVMDIDGNGYHSVTIGTQTWMVENLKTTKYNDGTSIPNVTDNTAWTNLSTPAYCWFDNDATTYKNRYGAMYNWYALNTAKLAPTGWHVPTDAEWTTLSTYLGGESVAGGKLKEAGTLNWASPNTSATNETGFTALPGGYRADYGVFNAVGSSGQWWSSTECYTIAAWIRDMYYDNNNYYPFRSNGQKSYGLSVRCVRDDTANNYTITTSSNPTTGGTTSGGGTFVSGSSKTVTATANTGYTFTNWTENGTSVSTNSSYQFIMPANNRTLVANFTAVLPNTFTLTVNATNGSVLQNPFKVAYNSGDIVTLIATPNIDYAFSSWSGDATGSSSTTIVTMNSDKNATANFIVKLPATFTLNVTTVNGTVTKAPDLVFYPSGSNVTLTPSANPGYKFDSWGGDASGNADPLTVIMNSDKNITANFNY